YPPYWNSQQELPSYLFIRNQKYFKPGSGPSLPQTPSDTVARMSIDPQIAHPETEHGPIPPRPKLLDKYPQQKLHAGAQSLHDTSPRHYQKTQADPPPTHSRNWCCQ